MDDLSRFKASDWKTACITHLLGLVRLCVRMHAVFQTLVLADKLQVEEKVWQKI